MSVRQNGNIIAGGNQIDNVPTSGSANPVSSGGVYTALAGKVSTGHEVVDFQAPTAANNYTWYRKYADGWVEQGGIKNVGDTNSPSTVSLPVTMSDTNYFCTIQVMNATTGAGATAYVQDLATYNYTTTSFGINRGYNGPKRWMVCGLAAS